MANPNGIPSQSPGLRRNATLPREMASTESNNPNGVASGDGAPVHHGMRVWNHTRPGPSTPHPRDYQHRAAVFVILSHPDNGCERDGGRFASSYPNGIPSQSPQVGPIGPTPGFTAPTHITNPNGVVSGVAANPSTHARHPTQPAMGLIQSRDRWSQGRPACRRPTLGFGTQSRWDWASPLQPLLFLPFKIHHSKFKINSAASLRCLRSSLTWLLRSTLLFLGD
jgi:hypothetical protein